MLGYTVFIALNECILESNARGTHARVMYFTGELVDEGQRLAQGDDSGVWMRNQCKLDHVEVIISGLALITFKAKVLGFFSGLTPALPGLKLYLDGKGVHGQSGFSSFIN